MTFTCCQCDGAFDGEGHTVAPDYYPNDLYCKSCAIDAYEEHLGVIETEIEELAKAPDDKEVDPEEEDDGEEG